MGFFSLSNILRAHNLVGNQMLVSHFLTDMRRTRSAITICVANNNNTYLEVGGWTSIINLTTIPTLPSTILSILNTYKVFFFLSLEGGQKEETRKQRDWGGDGAAVFYVNKLPSASRRHELEFGLANDCCLTCTWNWGRCIQLSKLWFRIPHLLSLLWPVNHVNSHTYEA